MSDFSRPPDEVLAENLDRGYTGLRVRQGVPVLDRDLNLLQDLVAASLRRIVSRYIGDGVPLGSMAFAIEATGADNDFTIRAPTDGRPGRCLVDGIEVTIVSSKAYRSQPRLPALAPPRAGGETRTDLVYLDVSVATVTEDQDPSLRNPGDINVATSVRLRPAWVVRVEPGSEAVPTLPAGHAGFPLARIVRPPAVDEITREMVTDLRRACLTPGDIGELVVRPVFGATPFDPLEVEPGGGLELSGRNFLVGDPRVFLGDTEALVDQATATRIEVTVPTVPPGGYPVTVVTAGGRVTSEDEVLVGVV